MKNLIRYRVKFDTDPDGISSCNCDIFQHSRGEYVKFKDIKELLTKSHDKRIKRAKRAS